MLKNILLCTDGSGAANIACEYAIWFTKRLNTSLEVLYITDIRILEGPLLADLSGAIGAQPFPGLLPQLQEIQRQKANTILSSVQSRCKAKGVSCESVHETGSLTHVMLECEKRADLVILGQKGEHASLHGDMLGSSVERMVRASVKPCLVTPDEFRAIQHILIAYDGSTGSKKGLRLGIELASKMNLSGTVLSVARPESEEAASKCLDDAIRACKAKGLEIEPSLAIGNAEEEILRESKEHNADLIVMGAYGHTRIRELILGSTTSHVMRKSHVPVLLARD